MHQGRHWPHQVLGHELSQNLTKSSTAPLNVKWKHHPKHCGIQIFDNHQPVSVCKKWLKYYPTTWMDRGRKVGRFMSLPFLKPSSDLPVTCLPPIYLPWTWTLDPSGASAPSVEILGSFQHLPAIGLFQGQDVHWMKLRPAYVRTCHQLLG